MHPVIVIVDADGKDIKLGDYEGKGFFKPACLKVYNKYSDTNELDKMEDDQLDKMKKHRGGSDKDYFLLSWTLTQSDWQALSCGSQTTDSILDLAKKAIPPLDHKLFNHISKDCYPNIIYTDNVHDNNVGPMAMAVNCKAIF